MSEALQHAKVLWIDFMANANSLIDKEKRETYIINAKKAGFTHVVIDAKTPYGYVTGKSSYAPPIGEWERFKTWKDKDYVFIMLELINHYGLKAILKLDVFGEGKVGDFVAPPIAPDWLVSYQQRAIKDGKITAKEREHSIFVNPELEIVQKYELNIMREFIKNYGRFLDAVILDRCRYPKDGAEFMERTSLEYKNEVKKRAQTIYDFVLKAKQIVKNSQPVKELNFGVYVGSWYPDFHLEGVNWASKEYLADYDWVIQGYEQTGYAQELDFIMTGCYYPDVYRKEALQKGLEEWKSVEGAIDLSNKVTMGETQIIPSIFLHDYKQNEKQFLSAMEMCGRKNGSFMLFDAVYLEMYDWWKLVK
ncbi:alpha amylase family protein [Sutcliffiella rhizosphaerae]|uniref:Glycosyl hydrolase-like 10 domain-containing protein n=1 Tax=Sutcliffiella rhizosphaerae TaxID=2880967 RepID=A0ABM8YML4_9BACI|nr:alpha amylase family protein [Sutcliffiella rhizosphaerae]CAG9621147.1 hypothetical protein BACCIP111883_01919 [Sutcliffiella rhizosphaerae]